MWADVVLVFALAALIATATCLFFRGIKRADVAREDARMRDVLKSRVVKLDERRKREANL